MILRFSTKLIAKRFFSNARDNLKAGAFLLALDADEALSANCLESKEWKQIADAEPGTILRFRWVNILPGFKEAWIPPKYNAFGFVDDGCDFTGLPDP